MAEPNGGWIGKVIRSFDQYLGAWVGFLIFNTAAAMWVEKMFVMIRWNPEKEMFVNQPMFPTPDWWWGLNGMVAIILVPSLAKLGFGYWTNSKLNSALGQPPGATDPAAKAGG